MGLWWKVGWRPGGLGPNREGAWFSRHPSREAFCLPAPCPTPPPLQGCPISHHLSSLSEQLLRSELVQIHREPFVKHSLACKNFFLTLWNSFKLSDIVKCLDDWVWTAVTFSCLKTCNAIPADCRFLLRDYFCQQEEILERGIGSPLPDFGVCKLRPVLPSKLLLVNLDSSSSKQINFLERQNNRVPGLGVRTPGFSIASTTDYPTCPVANPLVFPLSKNEGAESRCTKISITWKEGLKLMRLNLKQLVAEIDAGEKLTLLFLQRRFICPWMWNKSELWPQV